MKTLKKSEKEALKSKLKGQDAQERTPSQIEIYKTLGK